jgi:tungstate transport system permease protein
LDLWAAVTKDVLLDIIGLSLGVSLSATVVAALLGLPLGAALAVYNFPGRRALIIVLNGLLGLPPVVVGLALYLLLSRSGPLGWLGLLFTPGGMILAQATLATPIIGALAHRAVQSPWNDYADALRLDVASRMRVIHMLLAKAHSSVLTAVLAGFGRTISEVGAILIVGGNIAGYTRTMTTTIVLETSKGNLSIAIGLGFVLIGISIAVSAVGFVLSEKSER